jgi:hypothetical protein
MDDFRNLELRLSGLKRDYRKIKIGQHIGWGIEELFSCFLTSGLSFCLINFTNSLLMRITGI